MPNWGGLNNALFSWRNGLNALLPNRSTASDGARADSNHGSASEHQPDSDGTVDAFDEDRNYLGSSNEGGNAVEDRILAALNKDFMADSRAHLIISDRKIYNDEIGNWRARNYTGNSPHDHHTHRQVHQSKEDDGRPWKFTHTKALLEEINMPTPAEYAQAVVNKIAADLDNPASALSLKLAERINAEVPKSVWAFMSLDPYDTKDGDQRSVSAINWLRYREGHNIQLQGEVLAALTEVGNKVDALNPPDTGTSS